MSPNADPRYLEALYQDYLGNAQALDASWRHFFQGFEFALHASDTQSEPPSDLGRQGDAQERSHDRLQQVQNELQVYRLIHAYRSRGHLLADTNPVRQRRDHRARLELKHFELSEEVRSEKFVAAGQQLGLENASLDEIEAQLQKIYTGHLGFEYMYIRQPEVRQWLQYKIEREAPNYSPSQAHKQRILSKLNEAETFEKFLNAKYIGQKRFSLEGAENAIAALDALIVHASEQGVEEIVIGMPHRGRLNVLANILGKTYEQIFQEFEGISDPGQTMGDGDVKYHLGFASSLKLPNDRSMYVKLSPNPSHLEAVNPVVLGYTRAQIDDEHQGDFSKAIPVLLHGDAAVAGQGIIYECAQMSQLEGFRSGGCIHFVINNQIGFTTDYYHGRSSIYCTDVAKIIDAPVIHVNGDDPEAVVFAVEMAVEYRQKFERDIFIDMVCYRRHGHNEADEPKFTQPQLYKLIEEHPTPRELYMQKLIERGDVDAQLAEKMDKAFRQLLQDRLNYLRQETLPYEPQKIEEEWHSLTPAEAQDFQKSPETGISSEDIDVIAKALTHIPDDFKPLRQIQKLLESRQQHFFEDKELNWADAELLAYGSLLLEGKIVRLTGQDVQRGTFSHRHAVFYDAESNEAYCQLDHLKPKQKQKFRIFNSLLSEYGVLGFEYGYAMATPQALVIWEAQFGDFANGAQVMIDQFISSAESKWQRMNGLVMLLPHGYEGQGPEHSNARPERFLQLAADDNTVVANITEPANLFHLLRRQLAWPFRKPCVVMSPKSLLRHKRCVSPLDAFSAGRFREVLDDPQAQENPEQIKRVLLCTGKIYYDLLEKKENDARDDVAIVRIEQLAPFPTAQLNQIVKAYGEAELYWVQEEPGNMGYWSYILRVFRRSELQVISRRVAASPATGYGKVHAQEQAKLIERAFQKEKNDE